MIVGVSLILCAFTYLAYRRLCSGGEPDSPAGTPAFLWHFLTSAPRPVQHQPPPPRVIPSDSKHEHYASSSSSPSSPPTPPPAPAILPPPSFNLPISPETTPKATPTIISSDIPGISLAGADPDSDSDDDTPPSFPAMNSHQRASIPSSIPLGPMRSMPPPPLPRRNPNQSSASLARGAPQSRLTVLGAGASGVAAGNGLTLPKSKGRSNSKSRKVTLEPGHSPLDWARLQKSGGDLRGLPHPHLLKIPPSQLAKHRKAPDDIWMALDGKVYNITAYIPFHPGGEKELLRGAGKDGTKLFGATHPWVNVEGMLGECLVGILVSEEEATAVEESVLDQVD